MPGAAPALVCLSPLPCLGYALHPGLARPLVLPLVMTVQGVGMALAGVAAKFAGTAATVDGAGALGILRCALLAAEARRTEGREALGGGEDAGDVGPGTERRDGADHDMTGR
ncbi:hypothetical protein ACFYP4_20245 [Streptomyces sp. NPDC005551]|uniref:hypothetical protein n=1 Tax=Streptomyces sp. NPDC005551 TaxID=3364725 RepID=UPI0036A7D9DC